MPVQRNFKSDVSSSCCVTVSFPIASRVLSVNLHGGGLQAHVLNVERYKSVISLKRLDLVRIIPYVFFTGGPVGYVLMVGGLVDRFFKQVRTDWEGTMGSPVILNIINS